MRHLREPGLLVLCGLACIGMGLLCLASAPSFAEDLECVPVSGWEHEEPTCTITWEPGTGDPPAGNGCATDQHRVKQCDCQPDVFTYADAACTGQPAPCTIQHCMNKWTVKKIHNNCSPAVGTCGSPGTNCTCSSNGTITYTWGRKMCNGC